LYIDHLQDNQLFDDRTGEKVSRVRLKQLIGEDWH
jgi:hypothetical protein